MLTITAKKINGLYTDVHVRYKDSEIAFARIPLEKAESFIMACTTIPDPKLCPASIRDALHRYCVAKTQPGRFLYCCLANDLLGAIQAADDINVHGIHHIMEYIRTTAGPTKRGSRKIVEQYLEDSAR